MVTQGAKPGVTLQDILDQELDWLLESTFLAYLTAKEKVSVLASMEWRQFNPGDIIIEVGAVGQGVFLLVSGQAFYDIPDTIENRLICYNWGIGNLRKKVRNRSNYLPKETINYIKKYKSQTPEVIYGHNQSIKKND